MNLFVGSLARLYNLSLEVECLAGQGVVEIHFHLVVGDGKHTTVKSVAVFILQGHDGIHEDIVVVEMSVDREYFLVQVKHMGVFIVAVSLLLGQCEVETVACGE